MFGYRTPLKAADGEKSPPKPMAGPSINVRRSIGDWEATNSSPNSSTNEQTTQAGPAKSKAKPVLTPEGKASQKEGKSDEASPPSKPKYANRVAEARAYFIKIKHHLNLSRNLKTEIKAGITEAAERLYQLAKESEAELKLGKQNLTRAGSVPREPKPAAAASPGSVGAGRILQEIEAQSKLIQDNNRQLKELKEAMDNQTRFLEQGAVTYASVAAALDTRTLPKRNTLHSVVVASKDETHTGEEVLDRVRKAVNASDGWIKVERVRKAKDRKIIIGLQSEKEREKIKDRLKKDGVDLTVEEVKNKDPLLILRNVLAVNTDEDVLKALRNQNRSVFDHLDVEENRVEVRYRRRTRNPHAVHIIISVSPAIWRRAVEVGTAHIDLQRVRVEDQSPLVQCTRCLGFGHGKRFCREPADLCSHCGGPHLRAECLDRLSNTPPACRNCVKARTDHSTHHNAFSQECPVRQKWDEIARSTVAYC